MTDLAPADSIRTVGRHVSLSLYTRAMLWIGASLAFVTALSVSLSVHEKRVDLNRGLIERLRQASAQQAIAVSDLLWKLNREGVEIVLKGMANDLDFIAVRLLDDKGRVFASVGPRDIEAQSTEINEAPVVLPAEEGSRQIGTLLLYFSRARLEAVQREVIWHAWWLGMLQLGAVLLATAIALRAVIKPLEAITDRMLAVAGGDVMSQIPFKERSDQLGNIAHAVEVFAREMQARRQATRELELAQQQLEQ
ncbi:MAG TPA: HAMP domain-containing protein, partial [Reyranella sp.]|nr:HAMP domain-containing protein [Reyranella sp.]